jgi:hypothetical protein
VLRDALSPMAAGIGLGVFVLFLIGRLVRALIYGVPAPDRTAIAGAAAILTAVAIVATMPPLRRALRVSPGIALRDSWKVKDHPMTR